MLRNAILELAGEYGRTQDDRAYDRRTGGSSGLLILQGLLMPLALNGAPRQTTRIASRMEGERMRIATRPKDRMRLDRGACAYFA